MPRFTVPDEDGSSYEVRYRDQPASFGGKKGNGISPEKAYHRNKDKNRGHIRANRKDRELQRDWND